VGKQPKTCYFPSNSLKPNLKSMQERSRENQRLMLPNIFLVTVFRIVPSGRHSNLLRRGFLACVGKRFALRIAVSFSCFYAKEPRHSRKTSSEVFRLSQSLRRKQAPRSESVSSPQQESPIRRSSPNRVAHPHPFDAKIRSPKILSKSKQSKRIFFGFFPNYRAVSANHTTASADVEG